MYNKPLIDRFISFIEDKNGIADKSALSGSVKREFQLTTDRSVFFCDSFAVRFCKAGNRSFSNTVLSLSALQKYDKQPFFVCLVTPQANYLMLANTTFLRKISHSSQELRVDNIKGSFNGSDIMRTFENISNEPENFEFLFTSHENFTFQENLVRLVAATNNIHPTGKKFIPTYEEKDCIIKSAVRAKEFLLSDNYNTLDHDLRDRVKTVASEIAIAAFIDNVNLRGRIIEYLITAEDDLKTTLINALHSGTPLPEIYTADELGDYTRAFERFNTATDIKTKILFLSSNPKGYNIDKLLSFLSTENSVYMIFVVGIDKNRNITARLCSMYNRQLLEGTRIINHWAGRNSRGVTQYDGAALESILSDFDCTIDENAAELFIKRCIEM